MPTINLNRKELEKHVGDLGNEEFKDRIPMLGTALESIDSEEIVVEIFPNRPDMLSMPGFARAFKAFLGKSKIPVYKVKSSGHKVFVGKDMKNIRPYTACAIVKNLKLDDEKIKEIIEVQEKLHLTYCRKRKKAAMGIYPFEMIKPPIYLKCDSPKNIVFRPLEFPDKITAEQVLSEHPTGQKYAHLVQGMDKYAYFSDSSGEILSFTPIINSYHTGRITKYTKQAFVEVSGFDFHVCELVLNILVTTLADMGGSIYSMKVVYPDKTVTTPDLKPKMIEIKLDYINKRLGTNITEKDLKKLLVKMGMEYSGGKVKYPAYRADILHPIDIVEDVAIAYGYENLVPDMPVKGTTGKETNFETFASKVAHALAGLGLLEVSSFHLTNNDVQNKKMLIKMPAVEIENALNRDYNVLRSWLLPGLLQILSENKHNEYPQEIFEIGRVFKADPEFETGVHEFIRLACVLCGKDFDYTKIRQVFDYLLRSFGIEHKVVEVEHLSFIPGRVGRVLVDGNKVAYIGEISPEVLSNFDLEMPVVAFELNLSELFTLML